MANPWFRMYSEIIDHESIRLLSFEDRWHYVSLLCCKNSGLLDKEQDQSMMMRKLAVKLGLAKAELDSALLRLSEVGLITLPDCQPTSWEKRQYLPNKGLPGSEDFADKRCYVYFIGEQSSGRVKIGFSRNPWARLTNLQTANSSKLEILCHLRTNGVSESEIHRLLSGHSIGGEWFVNEGLVSASIAAIKAGKVSDASALEALLASGAILDVAKSVAATVAATTDTDTDTDTDQEEEKKQKTIRAPSAHALLPDVATELVDDFVKLRKAKRASVTQTAVDGIRREANKAGYTMEQAIRTCCERGWQGFKAEWVANSNRNNGQNHAQPKLTPSERIAVNIALNNGGEIPSGYENNGNVVAEVGRNIRAQVDNGLRGGRDGFGGSDLGEGIKWVNGDAGSGRPEGLLGEF